MTTRAQRFLFATATLVLACVGAHAQTAGGAKPIRLVVPFAAGSYTDNLARIMAPPIAERLGAAIVVDNRPGANGIIGADIVAKAPPDGLTLLMGGTSVNAINPGVYKSLPYDPVKDLLPVAQLGEIPFMLLASTAVPGSSVADFVAYAKKNPGKLAYGTPTSATLVGMETLKRLAGIDILGVPYKSSPQAMGDLVANQIQVIIADWATGMPHVRSGKVKVLAVTMPRRSTLMPDTPTVDETYKGYEISAWSMIYAPGATPREPVARFADALLAALGTAETRERLARIGFDVNPVGPDQARDYARAQMASWARLIKEAGIQPE